MSYPLNKSGQGIAIESGAPSVLRPALSRRAFMASLSAGSLVLATRFASGASVSLVGSSALDFEPDLFVSIDPTGLVTILAHRSEMGTGIRTALPMVVADELGADWERVVIEQSIGDARTGSQNTDGSQSVRGFYDRMRIAGATARRMLEQAAAQEWGVDAEECNASEHKVTHKASKRSLGFGELVEAASKLDVPAPQSLRMRDKKEYRIVGKNVPLTDMDGLLDGSAKFGIDARLDGQLYAVIARSPVLGGTLVNYDSDAALAVDGVVEVLEIPPFEAPHSFQALGGVAVVATNTWAAIQGRKALAVEWEAGPNGAFESKAFEAELAESARTPGRVCRDEGDAVAALKDADPADVFSADYYVPFLAHAPMEPPCALANVELNSDGQVTHCEVWTATQNPQAAQGILAGTLGIPPEQAIVNVTLLGGGFGRKSKPDYVAEAAILSRDLGAPVHVTWTREDDIRHDYYHTVGAVHMQAVQDKQGKPTAWLQRSAFPPITSTFVAGARDGGAGEMGMGFTDLPYALDHLRVENSPASAHLRIGWLRSVAHIYHAFGVCSFPDELAHRAGKEPLSYLLELLGEDRHLKLDGVQYSNGGESMEDYPIDIARLRHVTERAAKLAGWGRKLPKGKGLGIACHRSFLSYCATVVEVDVSKSGVLSITKVSSVIDAGTVIHPDRVKAQMEGAAVFGTSLAVHGEITAKDGAVIESNFDTYPLARMNDAPKEIQVEIVENDAPPGGVGEVGVPPFAPALCNAIFAATGKRVRRLPIRHHDLSWS